MIQLAESHLFVYEGKITSPNVKHIHCSYCNRDKPRYGYSVWARGWVCHKTHGKVYERFCPNCAAKEWPKSYAEAMKTLRGG